MDSTIKEQRIPEQPPQYDNKVELKMEGDKANNNGKAPTTENEIKLENNTSINNIPLKPISNDTDNEIRKRGFFAALSENPKDNYINLINEYKQIEIDEIEKEKELLNISLDQIDESRKYFIAEIENEKLSINDINQYIETLSKRKQEIETELSTLKKNYKTLLNDFAEAKSKIIENRIAEVKNEIEQITSLLEHANNKINKEFTEDFKSISNKNGYDPGKIYLDQAQEVEKTIKSSSELIEKINDSGINDQNTNTLKLLSYASLFVGGWLFSIWTGPIPTLDGQTLSGNSSIQFIVIDLITERFSQSNELYALAAIILIIALITLFNFCFHWLQKKIKNSKQQEYNHTDTQHRIKIESHEFPIKSHIQSTSTFLLWLKIAPFILTIAIFLLIVSKYVFKLNSNGTITDKFQELFDSMTHQTIGIMIGLGFTALLFFISNHSMKKIKKEEQTNGIKRYEFHAGLVLFSIMILSMVIFPISKTGSNWTISKIFFEIFIVTAFFLFSFGGALLLSKVLYFSNIKQNYYNAINLITRLNELHHSASTPKKITLLSYERYLYNIENLHQQLAYLTALKTDLASKLINKIRKNPHLDVIDLLYDPIIKVETKQSNSKVQENSQIKDKTEDQQIDKKDTHNNIFQKFWKFISTKDKFNSRQQKKQSENNAQSRTNGLMRFINSKDIQYFSEYEIKLKSIERETQDLIAEMNNIDKEIQGKWTGHGIYGGYHNRINSLKNEIGNLDTKKIHLIKDFNTKIKDLKKLRIHNEVLLQDGYHVGTWFNKQEHAHNS